MIEMTSRLKSYCCVINAPADNQEKIYDYLNQIDNLSQSGYQYFAIIHDKDFNGNGVLKTKHIHLILSNNTRPRAKQVLTTLCDLFNCCPTQLSLQQCVDLTCSVQYLIHKNDLNKTQYLSCDIVTNVSRDVLIEYLDRDCNSLELDFETLKRLWIECDFDELTLMAKIGLGRYQAYRGTIKDFITLFNQKAYKNHISNPTDKDFPF